MDALGAGGALSTVRLEHADAGVYFAPVRHHSPACAAALRAMIAETGPKQVLIEAPHNAEPLIPILLDPATRPPVAIVVLEMEDALRRQSDSGGGVPERERQSRAVSYYPFCAHSPEYVAMAEAASRGARLSFIDLPTGAARQASRLAPRMSLTDEQIVSMSSYVAELCRRTGCRDHNELWGRLFEQRLGADDWRTFFSACGVYGAASRATVSEAALEADGTLAREAFMAAQLHDALALPMRPILVVTGAMHTPALVAALQENGAAKRKSKAAANGAGAIETKSYVIRYGFRELDRLNGYAAGMPSPAYYQHLWQAAEAGKAGTALWRDVAANLLTGFTARLAAERPDLVPPLPSVANALEQAMRLAELRGNRGPGRQDLIDACASAFVKEETTAGAPVMAELERFLAGEEIGDVPPSAGSPPLVEAVRAQARRLGFSLEFASRKKRELDVYRNRRHLAASRFLHAMAFLETGFGTRTGGPDFLGGYTRDILFETWMAAWSPMVEARLIELSPDGDTLEAVARRRLLAEASELEEQGQGHNASAGVKLLLTACLIGLQGEVHAIATVAGAQIEADADLASVTKALSELFLLWRSRAMLGLTELPAVEELIGAAYRRALYLLEDIANTSEDRLRPVLGGLAALREVVASAADEAKAVDGELFFEAVVRLLGMTMPPLLDGALAALAYLSGHRSDAFLVARIRGSLAGAYVNPADRIAALNGMIAMTRELLWRTPGLLQEIDGIVAGLDEEEFLNCLPHLRLCFSALNPGETDTVAERIAALRGADRGALAPGVTYGIGEVEVAENLALAAALKRQLDGDGLGHWFADNPAASLPRKRESISTVGTSSYMGTRLRGNDAAVQEQPEEMPT